MLRFFTLFGRSSDLIAVDDALRTAGVHPLLIPEPVKLTILQLLRKYDDTRDLEAGLQNAAAMLAYCVLDHAPFAAVNGTQAADATAARLQAALDDSATLDEKLILLTLHAGVIAPDVAERFDLAVDGG